MGWHYGDDSKGRGEQVTTALTMVAFIIALLVIIYGIYKAGEHSGSVKERNETLENNIAERRKRDEIETDVARMSDADVTKRLSKWKRPF